MGQSRSQRCNDIEMLARAAARLAGRDPDAHVEIKMAGIVAFDDVMWRYPDFLQRATAAYSLLAEAPPPMPSETDDVALWL